jgi:hypothetical protein
MALWRCPQCGSLQPVAARCWVCRRSSTSCATCRHFRTSVAARIGYCGLDRGREPLTGKEVRSCWAGRPLVFEDAAAAPVESPPLPVPGPVAPYLSGFVPVDPLPVVATPVEPARPDPAAPSVTVTLPTAVETPAAPPDGLLWAELEA